MAMLKMKVVVDLGFFLEYLVLQGKKLSLPA